METNHFKKLKMHKLISLMIIFIGLALVTFMIVVEDEPGAIPLAMILVGTGCYFFAQSKLHKLKIKT